MQAEIFALLMWMVLIAFGIAINIWIGIYIVRKGVEAGIMRATANLLELGLLPVGDAEKSHS